MAKEIRQKLDKYFTTAFKDILKLDPFADINLPFSTKSKTLTPQQWFDAKKLGILDKLEETISKLDKSILEQYKAVIIEYITKDLDPLKNKKIFSKDVYEKEKTMTTAKLKRKSFPMNFTAQINSKITQIKQKNIKEKKEKTTQLMEIKSKPLVPEKSVAQIQAPESIKTQDLLSMFDFPEKPKVKTESTKKFVQAEKTTKTHKESKQKPITELKPIMVLGNSDPQNSIVFKTMSEYFHPAVEYTYKKAAEWTEWLTGTFFKNEDNTEKIKELNGKVNDAIQTAINSGTLKDIAPEITGSQTTYEHSTGNLIQEKNVEGKFKFHPEKGFTGVLRVERKINGVLDPNQVDVVEYQNGQPIAVSMAVLGESRIADIGLLQKEAAKNIEKTGISVAVQQAPPTGVKVSSQTQMTPLQTPKVKKPGVFKRFGKKLFGKRGRK